MTAELLRRAADLIEQRAASATLDIWEPVENYPDSWHVIASERPRPAPPHPGVHNPPQQRFGVAVECDEGDLRAGDAQWIAMLGPQLAQPLAAWLRQTAGEADGWESAHRYMRIGGEPFTFHHGPAEAIARVILEEQE